MLYTDVIVAGGGVAGLLIAGALAKEHSVLLLEQHDSFPRNKYWLTDVIAGIGVATWVYGASFTTRTLIALCFALAAMVLGEK